MSNTVMLARSCNHEAIGTIKGEKKHSELSYNIENDKSLHYEILQPLSRY